MIMNKKDFFKKADKSVKDHDAKFCLDIQASSPAEMDHFCTDQTQVYKVSTKYGFFPTFLQLTPKKHQIA